MNDEFLKYLASIGIVESLREIIERIFNYFLRSASVEITDIFVSDYLSEDGTREYKDLWLFSTKYWLEATDFIVKDHYAISPIKNRIVRWEIKKQDYNLEMTTAKSKLTLTVRFDTGICSEFNALKENCNKLRDIIDKHVVTNLKE